MDAALQVCRFFHFAATMAVFGAVAFRCYGFAGIDGDGLFWFDPRLARFETAAAIVALLSAGALLLCVTGSMAGAASAAFDPATLRAVLFDTSFGAVWRWRLVLAAVLVAVCLRPRWRRRTLLLLLSGVLLASLGWVGHAAMDQGAKGIAHKFNQSLHLLGAGTWLGGLPPLGWLLWRAKKLGGAQERRLAGNILRRFSAVAAVAVAILAVTGSVNAALLVGDPEAALGTPYGRLLAVKVALYLAMTALALTNRFRLLPSLAGDEAALGLMCRNVAIEQALGLAILAIVSVLGTLAPPVHAGGL